MSWWDCLYLLWSVFCAGFTVNLLTEGTPSILCLNTTWKPYIVIWNRYTCLILFYYFLLFLLVLTSVPHSSSPHLGQNYAVHLVTCLPGILQPRPEGDEFGFRPVLRQIPSFSLPPVLPDLPMVAEISWSGMFSYLCFELTAMPMDEICRLSNMWIALLTS